MAKNRKKIPPQISDEVMDKSDGNCYCGKRGDHIHHIDGNPANNDFDNLILLCFDHHDDASVKYGLKKRLSPSQLKLKRNKLYRDNVQKRQLAFKHYSSTLIKITDENLFRAALDASIILEIIKIKYEFFNESDWNKRGNILWDIKKYSGHSSVKISKEIFRFLLDIANHTRGGMPANVSDTIYHIILEYFIFPEGIKNKKIISEIASSCSHVAFAITYDAFIHLGNMAVACSGLDILKFLYSRGKELKVNSMVNHALKKYRELEFSLQRPERNDLETAKRFLAFAKETMDEWGGLYNSMPFELYSITKEHRKEAHQRIKDIT